MLQEWTQGQTHVVLFRLLGNERIWAGPKGTFTWPPFTEIPKASGCEGTLKYAAVFPPAIYRSYQKSQDITRLMRKCWLGVDWWVVKPETFSAILQTAGGMAWRDYTILEIQFFPCKQKPVHHSYMVTRLDSRYSDATSSSEAS